MLALLAVLVVVPTTGQMDLVRRDRVTLEVEQVRSLVVAARVKQAVPTGPVMAATEP